MQYGRSLLRMHREKLRHYCHTAGLKNKKQNKKSPQLGAEQDGSSGPRAWRLTTASGRDQKSWASSRPYARFQARRGWRCGHSAGTQRPAVEVHRSDQGEATVGIPRRQRQANLLFTVSSGGQSGPHSETPDLKNKIRSVTGRSVPWKEVMI